VSGATDLRHFNRFEDAILGDGIPCADSSIRIGHPKDRAPSLAFIRSDDWDTDTYATCGGLGRLCDIRKDWNARAGKSKLVSVGREAYRCEIDISTFKWVRPRSAEDGFVRNNRLDNTISLACSKFVTTEVIGIQDINLAVLSCCDCHLVYPCSFEGAWI
jgi:hypothetical protein